MRLLVVEDEADLAQAVCDHLRAAGHAVDLAAGADLVLEIFAAVLTYELPDGTTQLQMMFTGVHDVRMRKWRACHGPSPGLIGQGVLSTMCQQLC